MDVSVEIHCGTCGSANYSMPAGAADEGPVRCNDCGAALGSVAQLKAELIARAEALSSEAQRRDLDSLRTEAPGG